MEVITEHSLRKEERKRISSWRSPGSHSGELHGGVGLQRARAWACGGLGRESMDPRWAEEGGRGPQDVGLRWAREGGCGPEVACMACLL